MRVLNERWVKRASGAMCLALLATPVAAAVEGQAAEPPRLPLEDLRVFVEAFDRVSSSYVEEVDDRTLLENAIRGMPIPSNR